MKQKQEETKLKPISHIKEVFRFENFFNGGSLQIAQEDFFIGKLNDSLKIYNYKEKTVYGSIEHQEEEIYNFSYYQGKSNGFLYTFTVNGMLRKIHLEIDIQNNQVNQEILIQVQKQEFLPIYMKIDQLNNYLLLCDSNGLIVIYETKSLKQVKELQLGFGFIKVSIINKQIFFLSKERKLFQYDLNQEKKNKVIQEKNKVQFSSFCFLSEQDELILLSGFDSNFYISEKGKIKQTQYLKDLGFVTCLESLKIKNQIIILMSNDKGQLYMSLYDEKEKSFKTTQNILQQNRHEIGKFLIDSKNNTVFAVTNESEIFQLQVSIAQNQEIQVKIMEEFSSYHDQVLDIKRIQDQGILVCTNSDYVKFYNLENKKLQLLQGHKEIVTCCDFFINKLITGSRNGQLFIWEFNQQQSKFSIIKKYQAHQEAIAGLQIGRKTGEIFISADLNGEIKIWNLQEGSFKSIKAPFDELNFAKISNNEKIIVAGSKKKQLVVIDQVKGVIVKTFQAHKKGIWDVDFSSTSNQFASGSSDCQIKIWEIENNEISNTITLEAQSPVLKLKYLLHDLQIISSHSDGNVQIWNLIKRTMVFKISHLDSRVWALEQMIFKKEQYFITGDNESNLIVYKDDSEDFLKLEITQQNMQRISKDQLQMKIQSKDFWSALNHCLEFQMHNSFLKSLEKWIGSLKQEDNIVIYNLDLQKDFNASQKINTEEIRQYLQEKIQEKPQEFFFMLKTFMSRSKYQQASHFVLRVLLESLDFLNIKEEAQKLQKKIQKFNLRSDLKIFQIFNQRNQMRCNQILKRHFYLDYLLNQEKDLAKPKEQQQKIIIFIFSYISI